MASNQPGERPDVAGTSARDEGIILLCVHIGHAFARRSVSVQWPAFTGAQPGWAK